MMSSKKNAKHGKTSYKMITWKLQQRSSNHVSNVSRVINKKSGKRFSERILQKTLLEFAHNELAIEYADDDTSYINWKHTTPDWFNSLTPVES